MAKRQPIIFDKFNGLWMRGPVDKTPPDHFSDCLNTIYADAEVGLRDGLSAYLSITNIKQMALFKPNPPFTGTNVPRILALNDVGELYDVLISTATPIYTNPAMTSFGFVNFFGRCYISPANGKTGLEDTFLYTYDGTTFRLAAGDAPTEVMAAAQTANPGNVSFGTYLMSYAFETSTGFITQPAVPFIEVQCAGDRTILVSDLPIGPAGTVARWVISTKAITLYYPTVGEAEFLPLYFVTRVANNTDSTVTLDFYEEQLIEDASYLYAQLTEIPAGVGLLDYKGRLISYGEYDDPSLARVSSIGEPEALSSTSGFLITDPIDNTGIRAAVEFRNILYLFKLNRSYMTEDNLEEASTWQVVNFEKSIGTESNGIADILDAKGSSSEGFLVASLGAIYLYNGVFSEPELSYKIRDLWLRINPAYFHLTQLANDTINKRIYALVALDSATAISHIIYGDYRNGLDSTNIKWSIWEFAEDPTSILIYTDFTGNSPSLVTRISQLSKIRTLNINTPSDDDGATTYSHFELAPSRFSYGMSNFNKFRIRATGPGTLIFTAYGQDKTVSVTPANLVVDTALPGREYAQLMNLISEQCRLKVSISGIFGEVYKVNAIALEGVPYADERPR